MAFGLSLGKKSRTDSNDAESSKKMKSDKSIKARSPKTTLPKKVLRTTFWIIASIIVVQGCVATMRGERVIQQINNYGVTTSSLVDDKVRGFATDFATEYFTWNYENLTDHSKRMSRFTSGALDPNAGLKTADIKGSSKVLSAEVYSSQNIKETLTEVTILIRREFTLAPPAAGKPVDPSLKPETSKVYMVVPVSQSDNGLLIQSYPRFVGDQLKGDAVKREDTLKPVSEEPKVKMAKDLAEGFLRAWYEGNTNQLKYFYLQPDAVPLKISPSAFALDKVEQVEIAKVMSAQEKEDTYQLKIQVSVKNVNGESFTNVWTIQATEKDVKMYVSTLEHDAVSKQPQPANPAPPSQNATSSEANTITEAK
ncbi:conjugal transfer protein [Paenibacillus sp. NPDC056579]|uniref:conjugal transfer protein n=1 Tax=Paenibacillus sp. NPDC056579 TaxID=3345871 RepID=UPI0036C42152